MDGMESAAGGVVVLKYPKDLARFGHKLRTEECSVLAYQLPLRPVLIHGRLECLGLSSHHLSDVQTVLLADGLPQKAFQVINHLIISVEIDMPKHCSLVEFIRADVSFEG